MISGTKSHGGRWQDRERLRVERRLEPAFLQWDHPTQGSKPSSFIPRQDDSVSAHSTLPQYPHAREV